MDADYALYHGYCEDYLATLPPRSVHAVITDPPYGVDYQSNHRQATDKFRKIAGDTAVPTEWMALCRPLIRPDGCLLTFCRWDTAEQFRLALRAAGWTITNQAIWDRHWDGMGDLERQMAPVYDVLWFCAEPGFKWHWKRPQAMFRHQRLAGQSLQHPNQKPLPLMKELVEYLCPPGGVVLDPYAGSGTTAVACVQTGRQFRGAEVDETYHRLGAARIRRAVEARERAGRVRRP